jgi:hypothetical protein
MPSNLAHPEGGRTAGAAKRRDHNKAIAKTEDGRKKNEDGKEEARGERYPLTFSFSVLLPSSLFFLRSFRKAP